MRSFGSLIITIIICFAGSVAFAQIDTIIKKQSLSLTAGTSMPLSEYKQTTNGGAYANTGLTIQSRYTYELFKQLSVEANYTFFANGINTDAIASTNKKTIEDQIGKEVEYSGASGNFWYTHNLMAGPNYKINLTADKKFSANLGILCGASLVTTPASETVTSVNEVFYRSSSKRTQNITLVYQGIIGLAYQIKPKTSFTFNAGYIGMNLKGYNLEVIDIGNNSYTQTTYKFEQKISTLNFTIGIATHF